MIRTLFQMRPSTCPPLSVGTTAHWAPGPRTLPDEEVLVGPLGTAGPAHHVRVHLAGPGMWPGAPLWGPAPAQEAHCHALQADGPQLLWEQPGGERPGGGQDHTHLRALQWAGVQLQPWCGLQGWGEHHRRPLHDQGERTHVDCGSLTIWMNNLDELLYFWPIRKVTRWRLLVFWLNTAEDNCLKTTWRCSNYCYHINNRPVLGWITE